MILGDKRRVLVTGGAGFIGSAVCRHLVQRGHFVVNVDKLTYSGNLASLSEIKGASNYAFVKADVGDERTVRDAMEAYAVDSIMHLAAETHVDRSIDGPAEFVETNIVGTFRLLSTSLGYYKTRDPKDRGRFRFLHVSTDEVFGDLPYNREMFTEDSRYAPSSPYSASKAGSDHLVRAWHTTYGLPIIVTICCNNYGPYHFPDKLIPLMVLTALEEKPLPIYGRGANVRDWIYVDDHVRGLESALLKGGVGETYIFGGRAERANLAVVKEICSLLDLRRPRRSGGSYYDLVTFADDRPGHDRRYAVDPSRAERELSWKASATFEEGLARTVDWFLANEWWWRPIRERIYAGNRLGLI